jgi:hypothetical protein
VAEIEHLGSNGNGNGNGNGHHAEEPALPATRETETLVVKLNAAARDLVEALEGRIPAELEQRYVAGERKAYVHHLFLQRGAKAVKEMKARYAGERIVKGRVDSYIRLFERLLDAIAETEDSAVLVDACLASESGKVYLQLAQASGRVARE